MENKRNFQRELDLALKDISLKDTKPVLLLHSCCGPCSSYVLEYLTQFFYIKLYFYNPNIHPEEEYKKRLEAQYKVIKSMQLESSVDIIEGSYDPKMFFSKVQGFESETEGGERCRICIKMRMEATALMAKKLNADYFATTLTVSPHKNALYINQTGEELEKNYQTTYLLSDFKKKNGYKRSIELCRIHDIYRQDYCGCVFSFRNTNE